MICVKCGTTDALEPVDVHGFHAPCFRTEFGLSENTDFQDLFERTNTAPQKPGDQTFQRFNSSFFHGKFRKYSGSLNQKNYILKVQQPDCPDLPAIEYLCNQAARLLGIQVPDHHFILFKGQLPTFVTRNFMDLYAAATSDHIYKFLKTGADITCENLCQIIQTETARLNEVHRFVEVCLFDSLIGNHDRHGRNLALITRAGSVRTLSPFYDNPSYVGIANELMLEADIQPRGAIATKDTSEPRMKDYLREFQRLELESAIDRFKQRIFSRSAALFRLISGASMVTDRRRNALIRLIGKRLEDLENA